MMSTKELPTYLDSNIDRLCVMHRKEREGVKKYLKLYSNHIWMVPFLCRRRRIGEIRKLLLRRRSQILFRENPKAKRRTKLKLLSSSFTAHTDPVCMRLRWTRVRSLISSAKAPLLRLPLSVRVHWVERIGGAGYFLWARPTTITPRRMQYKHGFYSTRLPEATLHYRTANQLQGFE